MGKTRQYHEIVISIGTPLSFHLESVAGYETNEGGFMRILIISYSFPPFSSMGATRVGKTAKYLTRFGHDVRVITANDQPLQPTMPLEIARDSVIYTRWLNINKLAERVFGGRQQVAATGYVPRGSIKPLLKKLAPLYKTFLHMPDGQIGWYPFAVKAARQLVAQWRPDLIYASASPFTSLLVAHTVARQFNIPVVVELRDLWVDNYNRSQPSWRRYVETRLERAVLSAASGLVTVSGPMADLLVAKYGKPTAVILNGFDAENHHPQVEPSLREDKLRIVYTGMIYEGKQDPSPLFQALQELGSEAERIQVAFYGRYLHRVKDLADLYGVRQRVEVHEQVSHIQSLNIQIESDILLLLLWNDPKERGVYTGKLFEYIGARRPILAIGLADNAAGDLIRERSAGITARDPSQIAQHLREWLQKKQTFGTLPCLPESVVVGLSREEQTRRLEEFLLKLVNHE